MSERNQWNIKYAAVVLEKDFIKIDKEIARRIRIAIEQKLIINPTVFGTPLRSKLFPLYKLRVGDWRVIYRILEAKKILEIIAIAHRKEVYLSARKRV